LPAEPTCPRLHRSPSSAPASSILSPAACGGTESDATLEIVAPDIQQDRVGVVLRAQRPDVSILDRCLSYYNTARAHAGRHTQVRVPDDIVYGARKMGAGR
jgi:hypothetical protein